MEFTKEEYLEWKASVVTKHVIAELKKDRQALLELFSDGTTVGSTTGETAQLTVRLLGEIAGIDHILNKEFDDYDD